ncbi:glycoside hydrolase family 43 protein [Parapedobacter soli]|uniref:glycoside hydrolase family 43 protein n=1 Tax=Parapedobacter soli TaxID=416955 RepID=UPI0021C8C78B|nr:glycoside hydrolase family 43 protein [Parapedobacter soli]
MKGIEEIKCRVPVLIGLSILAVLVGVRQTYGQVDVTTVDISNLPIRDPYILADEGSATYYLYKAAGVSDGTGKHVSGVVAYKSNDLTSWKGPITVFSMPSDNWIQGAIWAPEVHHYQGRYYLFATLNSDIEWKKQRPDWPKYTFRATQIFHSDSPEGPFMPFSDKLPQTPMDRMALDGTLWVENGTPYMIYCHEWVQIRDGSVVLQRLSPDLAKPVGPPLTLFHASSAPWSTGDPHDGAEPSYVTDGCFLYRTKTGKLLMIWSSFKSGSYAIGIAESATGRVVGPWTQHSEPLFEKDGGHGMLFTTFDEMLMLTFHSPNSPSGKERAVIYEVEDTGDSLVVIDKGTGLDDF